MASIVLPEGIQLLSGLEANRASVIPDVGEPLFTTDEQRLFVGDNATAGGNEISYLCTETGGTVAPAAGTAFVGLEGAAQALLKLEHTGSAGTNDNYVLGSQDGQFFITQRVGATETVDVMRVLDTGTTQFEVISIFTRPVAVQGNFSIGPLAGVASQFINGYGEARVVLRDLNGTADQRRFSLRSVGSDISLTAISDAGVAQRDVFTANFDGGITSEVVAGGSKGANTLNWQSIFQNNVAVATTSDEREKRDIEALTAGLADVRRLRQTLRRWTWKDADAHVSEPEDGVTAQALEAAGFGDWVITDQPGDANERKRVDKAPMPMIARLVNAVCELADRVDALEATP